MRATFPIITCDDDEDGCPAWTLDWYTATVSNWREVMERGWQYDPHNPATPHLCPDHAKEVRA